MSNVLFKIAIKISFVLIILMRIMQGIQSYRAIQSGAVIKLEYLLLEKKPGRWGGCPITLHTYLIFYLPRCLTTHIPSEKVALYQVGDNLEIIGTADSTPVKGNPWKKRLNIQSLVKKEHLSVSGKYLLSKMAVFLSVGREKIRALCQKIFSMNGERIAEAMLFSDIGILSQSTQLELQRTGIASFFQSVTLKIFFISDVVFLFYSTFLEKKKAVLFASASLLLCSVILSFTASSFRVALVLSFVSVVPIFLHRQFSYRSCSVCFVVITLLCDPSTIFSLSVHSTVIILFMRYLLPIELPRVLRSRSLITSVLSLMVVSCVTQLSVLPLKIFYAHTLDFLPVIVIPLFLPVYVVLFISIVLVLIVQSTLGIIPTLLLSLIKGVLHGVLALHHSFFSVFTELKIPLTESSEYILFIIYVISFGVLWVHKRRPKHSYRIY